MFTRSGSAPADPAFSREICDCLYTWRLRRLLLAQAQHTPEWTATERGFPAYERAVDVFIDLGDGEVVEELRVKPIDVADIASLYERCSGAPWAFAVCALTFVRHRNAVPPETVSGPPVPVGATWASAAHGVAVLDLKRRRLAGVCFVRELNEQPLAPLIFAADKLLDAFRTDSATVHVIAPVVWDDELEFLPWLLYAMRAPDIAEAVERAQALPPALRLTPAELLFWGFPSDFEDVTERTAVFPKPAVDSTSVLVGLNFTLRLEGRDVDVNFRFCQSGVEKGYPPHLDIQLSDKSLKRSPFHGVKLAAHVPVDLTRFAAYGLHYHLLAYARLRPHIALGPMIGATATEENLGLYLSMIRDPLYRQTVRDVLAFEPQALEHMIGVFNAVYRVEITASGALEHEINTVTGARWRETADDRRHVVLEAAIRLFRTRLVAVQVPAPTAEEAHACFLRDGREALAAFEAEVTHRR